MLDAAAEPASSREEFGGGVRAALMGAVSRVRGSAVAAAGAQAADGLRSWLLPPVVEFLCPATADTR
ncbi:hypothetical protein [Streptomyces gilvus]|uniref:hypothetical protein n=1 Tax=Streptomyces gilvus TaxID=2920937 RepID=UPI001F1172C0|nr:hypothetical protein [Streptomyces sp. CME 23]MCH5676879.1 hypothetical protein [Streptomyces sp. CME 23]